MGASWSDFTNPLGLFSPRTEGQYAGVKQSNFQLPGFNGMSQQLQGLYGGTDSVAQERLRQATAANMAQQQSMAAGAAPGNQAAAHLAAMQNSARLNQGMTGQATQAGIAERQAAMQGLMGLNQAQQQGNIAYEGNRTARAGAQMAQPTQGEEILGAGMGAAQLAMMKDGGVVTKPTHAIVGEAGPEAVIPLAKLPGILQALQQPQVAPAAMKPGPQPTPTSQYYGPAPVVSQYGPPTPQGGARPWSASTPQESALYNAGVDAAAQRAQSTNEGLGRTRAGTGDNAPGLLFARGVPGMGSEPAMSQGAWMALLHGLGVK